MVQAISRDDVALAPESLSFGHIQHGTAKDASVQVLLSGGNWKIVQAKSDSDYVEPRVRLFWGYKQSAMKAQLETQVRRPGGG